MGDEKSNKNGPPKTKSEVVFKNIYQQGIISLMVLAGRPLTTSQISKRIGISWSTAKKHLSQLKDEGLVKEEHLGNRIYWRELYTELDNE